MKVFWHACVGFKSVSQRRLLAIACLGITVLLTGCSLLSPHFLNLPVDASGHGINSGFSELNPHLTESYLVFISDRKGSQDVYLYDRSQRRLIDDLPGLNALDLNVSEADISGDGQIIVFTASRQGQTDLYLYNRPTGQLRNLTADLAAQVRRPSISANGNLIAFESDAEGQWDIEFRDRNGHPVVPPLPQKPGDAA